jgi:hypothetical protein
MLKAAPPSEPLTSPTPPIPKTSTTPTRQVRRAHDLRQPTKIEPAQELALLDFVASGKGFPTAPLRLSASRIPRYIALVGAQFQKHKTGEFIADIIKPEHQVMLGIQPFNVGMKPMHTKHNNDRTVLMERSTRPARAVDLDSDAWKRTRLLHSLWPR